MIRLFTLLLVLSTVVACKSKGEPEESDEQSAVKNEITLSQSQLELAEIKFGRAEMEVLHREAPARGQVTLPPGHFAKVSAYYDGIITRVFVLPGDEVKKGQVLAEFNSPEIISGQEALLKSYYRLPMLKANLDRQSDLAGQGISAEKIKQEAESEYRVELANYEGLKAKIKLMGISAELLLKDGGISPARVLSPIAGRLNKVDAHPGMRTESGEALFQVIDNRDLMLKLWLMEKDIPFVQVGQKMAIQFANIDIPGVEGEVLSIGAKVDEESRTISVNAGFVSKDLPILPGMFASCIIYTGEHMFYVLPESAIALNSEGHALIFYTLDKDDADPMRFKWMKVDTGVRSQGKVEIQSELYMPENARIVMNGGYFLLGERWKNEEE